MILTNIRKKNIEKTSDLSQDEEILKKSSPTSKNFQ